MSVQTSADQPNGSGAISDIDALQTSVSSLNMQQTNLLGGRRESIK
jgi:hypothetical protein